MSKVLYLMGAGASFGKRLYADEITGAKLKTPQIIEGMPIVNEINNEINVVIQHLKNVEPNYQQEGNAVGTLIYNLNGMKKEASRHMTIDTLAKSLFLQGKDNEFDHLKRTLSAFFMLTQGLHPEDKRYDAFLANILTYPNKTIPDDISIVTWNYDSQFEIAYREFNPTSNYTSTFGESIRRKLGVKESHYEDNYVGKIFKLNGSAMTQYYGSHSKNAHILDFNDLKRLKQFAEDATCDIRPNYLRFAWETEIDCPYLREIYRAIEDVQTIVIIGYTFPYFNRQIDRALFNNMHYISNIYIQDPYPERIEQSLRPILETSDLTKSAKVHLLKEVDQFYLPSDL